MLRLIFIGLTFLACEAPSKHLGGSVVDASVPPLTLHAEPSATHAAPMDDVPKTDCSRLAALGAAVTEAPQDHGGLFVAVRKGDCALWTNHATGHEVFRLASLTKTVVATLALRAVDQGKLKLDARLDEVLPGVPEAQNRTLRMLLSHTSGIVSYDAAPGFWSQTSHERTPLELLALGRHLQHLAPPGEGAPFRYANANYTLVGILLESTYGKPLDFQLEALLRPLGVRSIRREPTPAVHQPMFTREGRETGTQFRPWMLFAAGDLVGSLEDLVTWTQVWGRGTLLSEPSRQAWLTGTRTHEANVRYGLGVSLRTPHNGDVRSHTGRLAGLNLVMTYDPTHDVAIAAVSTREGIETAPVTETIVRALQ